MHTVYLSLGSNVGDRKGNLARAEQLLAEGVTVVRRAPTYETDPVGIVDQPKFLNTAIEIKTDLAPRELLTFVKQIEKKVGRIEREHWGPREIDIDILTYDYIKYKDDQLEIPHPRMHERDFVLRPLADITSS